MSDKTPKYQKYDIATASDMEERSAILVIYTGGTIGMAHDNSGSLVALDFNHFVERAPSLNNLGLKLTVISFSIPLDSSNVSYLEWQELGNLINENHDMYDGFVILHGTDTMSFTASALSFMLIGVNKPVIFTGAQLPISAIRSDARANLVTALEIASAKKDGNPLVPEVCIYFDYQLMRGNRSFKKRSSQFAAFGCENYPMLAKAGISILYNETSIIKYDPKTKLKFTDKFCADVIILKIFPSIKESYVRHILSTPGLKGVVLETYGSGNAPTATWFITCLKEATDRGIIVYNVSQLIGGIVIHGRYETSKFFEEIGVIAGSDITREAAITKLMFLLGSESNAKVIRQKLRAPLCGELTLLK